jgi:ADP-ribosylglycohydrolase
VNQADEQNGLLARFRGCLLGGAVGDALGAPVEFMRLDEIREQFGADGVTGMVDGAWPAGSVTDDTQMTLFTSEGLLRADVRWASRGICHVPTLVDHAYARWLETQGEVCRRWGDREADGWLIGEGELHARRAPGSTCLSALRAERMGTVERPLNDSKGCGGVMRIAPVGLIGKRGLVFSMGVEIAALTHGHPSGYLSAGFMAALVAALRDGAPLESALNRATAELARHTGRQQTLAAVSAARELAAEGPPSPERVETLGGGWVAEEALAIAVYALAATNSLRDALLVAVNHSGDSDSTAAIAGNLAGALYGDGAIPRHWFEKLELREVIVQVSTDLYRCWCQEDWDPEREWERYPGW